MKRRDFLVSSFGIGAGLGLATTDAFGQAVFGGTYSRDIDHVILRLDPATVPDRYRQQRPDGDFPVAIARQYGKGRVFNIGWGEFEATWDDPGMQKFMLNAIQWALGSIPADITPHPLPKSGVAG